VALNREKRSNEINKWVALTRLSETERKEKQPNWDMIDDYFRGWQWNKLKEDNSDIVTVNLVYSHVKVIIPSVYLRYPKIYFSPESPAAIDGCRLLEKVLNADMRKMKLKDTNKRILQDYILYGTGFSKTTFEIEEGYEGPEDQSPLQGLQDEFNDTEEPASIQSAVGGKVSIPKASPSITRCSPRGISFACGITDFGDPGFIGHRSFMRVSKLKSDPYYKNTEDLKPSLQINSDFKSSLGSYSGYGAEEYLDMVEVIEIWDVDNQKWFTIAVDHDDYLTYPEDNPYPYDHPFDRLVLTPLEDQIWGMGEIEPWLPQQDELNSNRTKKAIHAKRFNRKYAVSGNAFETEEEQAKLERGEDGAIIKFRGNKPISEQFQAIQDAPLPADDYRQGIQILDDIQMIGRVNAARRGDAQGANTATEAGIVERSAQTGDYDRIDALGEFSLAQLEKVRKARRKFTVGQDVIDVTGNPLDLNRFQYWTKEDINVESMMSVEFVRTKPDKEVTRQSKALLLYQQALANPTVNPQAAFSKLLEAFGEQNQASWFQPQELIQIQMMVKALGAANEQKGISPQGSGAGIEPGPNQTTETPAELRGRAAPKINSRVA